MNTIIKVQAQYTIAQYLNEVIVNKVVFKPYDQYRLLIDPKEFEPMGLNKADYETEHQYFDATIDSYILHIQNKGNTFWDSNNDSAYIRQVHRTINRLIKALQKHKDKKTSAPNWAIEFYMPVFGIDIQRENAQQKRAERLANPVKAKFITDTKPKTANDLICIAYQIQENKSCFQKPFFDLASFQKWCDSKPIKGKNIRLQSIHEAKLINDCVVNSDNAIDYLTNTLQTQKVKQ